MNHIISKQIFMKTIKPIKLLFLLLILNFVNMSANAQPTDAQVLKDVVTDKTGLVDAYCSKTQKASRYWHTVDKAWYWDREMTIKRKESIPGAPNAVVVVTGIARYEAGTSPYSYVRFLVTTNEYEGLKGMSTSDLEKYLKSNIRQVFQSRLSSVTEVKSITANTNIPWIWHTPTSFAVRFNIHYKQIWSVTEVSEKIGDFEIRFYKDTTDGPITGVLAIEKLSEEKGREKYSEEQVRSMKTIGSN
jgi:hypothetical protein